MKLFLSFVLSFLATASGISHNISIDFSKLQVYQNVITRQPLIVNKVKGPIINGTLATSSTQFPYQVKIFLEIPEQSKKNNTKYNTCGGAIIAPKWVLTAGHCLLNAGRGYIFVGCVNTKKIKGSCKRIRVRPNKYFLHRKFINTKSDTQNDIGLIRLRRALKYSYSVNKIDLNTDLNIPNGENVVVSGFGVTKTGKLSQTLKFTSAKTIEESTCKKYFPTVNSTMICVGTSSPTTSYCQGDSGGPLTINKNGKVSLVGINSYGGPNCLAYPAVYTRITALKDWICTLTGTIVSGCPKKWRHIHKG